MTWIGMLFSIIFVKVKTNVWMAAAQHFPANRFKALDYVFEVSFKCVFIFFFLCDLPSPFFLSGNHPSESYYEFVGITRTLFHWYQ